MDPLSYFIIVSYFALQLLFGYLVTPDSDKFTKKSTFVCVLQAIISFAFGFYFSTLGFAIPILALGSMVLTLTGIFTGAAIYDNFNI